MVRTVIFVARQDDIHADAVLDRCSRRGADVARFEMASPLRDNMKFEIVIDRQQTKWELLLGSHRVSDTDNLAVFCRDWEMSDRASAEELEQCVKNEEARAFLNAWAGLVPHSRWLD